MVAGTRLLARTGSCSFRGAEARRGLLCRSEYLSDDGYGFVAPVGSFPGDASPYGLLDVAGNAAEWVADWYDAQYYASSPARNPTGPGGGEERVYRGTISNAGGGPEKCRCVARYSSDPDWEFGLRCVTTTPPDEAATPPPPPEPESATTSEEVTAPEAEEAPPAPDEADAPAQGDAAAPGSVPPDIPVYPGASLLGEVVEVPDQYGADYELVGTWGYETEAGVDEVASFYLAEMPKFGWGKIMHMSMGPDNYISVWQKGDGQLGSTIAIGKRENDLTYIGIIGAKERQ